MDPITLYITGTAGVGKTTFTTAFKEWLVESERSVATVNLDPGMEDAGFEPDVDVRDWVKLSEIMDEHGLGPNGAQIAASDMVAVNIADIRTAVQALKAEIVLVDTPGQIELFAFRESSKAVVEELGGENSMIAFLLDPMLAKFPNGLVSLFMLSATVQFRFSCPLLNILAKDDLLTPEERESIKRWTENPDAIYDSLARGTPGADILVSREFFRALETLSPQWSLLPTSAVEERGFDGLYQQVQQIFTGGEDKDRDSGTTGEPL